MALRIGGEHSRRAGPPPRPRARLSIDVTAITSGDAQGDVPAEFRIFKLGVNQSEKGDFVFDEQSADLVMAAYRLHGKPMLLDFNHGTTLFDPTPDQGIAAGEFIPEVRPDGLWATAIKWTERARRMLVDREYRLFSPFFEHDSKSRILRLINVALTNLPALDHIEPLVAASASATEGEKMEWEKLYNELKAANEALKTELTELKAKLSTYETKAPEAAQAVALRAQVLTITGRDSDATALGALTAMKEQAAEVVALRAKLEEAQTATLAAEWHAHLDALSTKGKDGHFLPPAKRVTAERMALSLGAGKLTREGMTAAKEYVTEMMVAGAPSATSPPPAGVQISEQRKRIAKLSNTPIETVMKWEAEQLTKGTNG